MRKVLLSVLLAVLALSMTIVPALADSVGPPP